VFRFLYNSVAEMMYLERDKIGKRTFFNLALLWIGDFSKEEGSEVAGKRKD
jgi:hypothetical protein